MPLLLGLLEDVVIWQAITHPKVLYGIEREVDGGTLALDEGAYHVTLHIT
jgi:hypothetical protein